MRKLVALESVTVDGVFEAETMQQWAQPYSSAERDAYIRETVLAADALLLGRTTYDLQAWYWPSQQNYEYGIADRAEAGREQNAQLRSRCVVLRAGKVTV